MEDIHIVPLNDLKEHESSDTCHCKPRVEVIGVKLLIIHNAYDNRETIENIQEFLLSFQPPATMSI